MIKKAHENQARCASRHDFSVPGKIALDLQRHELTNRATKALDHPRDFP
jgi:hypothetical protein